MRLLALIAAFLAPQGGPGATGAGRDLGYCGHHDWWLAADWHR